MATAVPQEGNMDINWNDSISPEGFSTMVLWNFSHEHSTQFTSGATWGTRRYAIMQCATQATLCKDRLINANYTLLAHLPESYTAKHAIISRPFPNQEKLCLCSHFTSSTTLNSIWNTDINYPIVRCGFLFYLLHKRQYNTPTSFDIPHSSTCYCSSGYDCQHTQDWVRDLKNEKN